MNDHLTDVKYRPERPVGTYNRLYHAMTAGSKGGVDQVLLDTGGFLFIHEDRLQVTDNEGNDVVIPFEDLPEFDVPKVYKTAPVPDGDDRFQHIRAYGSDQTGGMVMVDWLEHKAGVLITVSDECVLLWKTDYEGYAAADEPFGLERGVNFHGLELI